MRHALAAVCGLSLAVAGCNCRPPDGPDSGLPPLDGSVPIELVDEVFAADVCAALIQCYQWRYCSVGDCRRDQAIRGLQSLIAELDAGWARYDPVAAFACHERFTADPCGFGLVSFTVPTVAQVLAACDGAIAGQRTAGQTCASVADCAAEAYCVFDARCPGTCLTWLGKGAACTVGGGASLCNFRQGLNCSRGQCRGGGELGTACTGNDDCKSSYCQIDAGVCRGTAALGARCTWLGLRDEPKCEADGWCDDHFTVGSCLPLSAAGGPCYESRDCQGGLVCGPNSDAGFGRGRCSSPLPAGAPCGQQTLEDCAAGLHCGVVQGARTCVPLPGLKEPCDSSTRKCSAGLDCEGVDAGTYACVQRRCLDEACGDGAGVCGEGLCEMSQCAPHRALGATCRTSGECATGTCDAGLCSDATCAP